jgi:ABC-type sugar transport system substrate-binding protein
MKKVFIYGIAIIFLTVISLIAVLGLTGCTNNAQTIPTIATAIESTTATTVVPAAPATEETVAEEKIPVNFELVYVPKVDVPWFDVVQKGIEQCAKDYGFKVTVTAPPKLDPAIQAQVVLDLIGKTADAVIVCPIEEASMDTALEKAASAGIMTFASEGGNLKNISYDFESISNEEFGKAIMQSAIKYSGASGSYAISVGFLDSKTQNEWADAEIALQKEAAPSMSNALGYAKGTDRFQDSEDETLAVTKITEIITANAGLKMIIGNSMTSGPAAAEAIAKQKLKGKLLFVGTGLPLTVGEHIKDGIIQEAFFWDPYMAGYSLGFMAFKAWEGKPLTAGDSVLMPGGAKLAGYEKLAENTGNAGVKILSGNANVSVNKDNLDSWYKKFEEYGWPQF